jgi:tyrosinase
MHTPGQNPKAVTRYEDFLIEHQEMTPIVHFTGVFLPWHRMFLHEIERAMRVDCGYRGTIP